MSRFPPGFYDPGWQQGGMPYQGPPGPVPTTPVDPEKWWSNPLGTVPGPLATEARGYWSAGGRDAVNFDAVVGEEYVAQAGISTPIFDLRPDLKGSLGVQPEAHPIFRGAAFGAGARLHLQFYGITNIPAGVNLRVYYVTRADVREPYDDLSLGQPNLARTCQPQEITTQFYNGDDSVIVSWSPDGGPVRYWQLAVFFRQYGGVVPITGLLWTGTVH